MVELADSLDSGSSVHYARAGSSPASRTNSSSSSEFEEFFFIKNSVFSAFENRDTRFLTHFDARFFAVKMEDFLCAEPQF